MCPDKSHSWGAGGHEFGVGWGTQFNSCHCTLLDWVFRDKTESKRDGHEGKLHLFSMNQFLLSRFWFSSLTPCPGFTWNSHLLIHMTLWHMTPVLTCSNLLTYEYLARLDLSTACHHPPFFHVMTIPWILPKSQALSWMLDFQWWQTRSYISWAVRNGIKEKTSKYVLHT